jgi:hypothetical protein
MIFIHVGTFSFIKTIFLFRDHFFWKVLADLNQADAIRKIAAASKEAPNKNSEKKLDK